MISKQCPNNEGSLHFISNSHNYDFLSRYYDLSSRISRNYDILFRNVDSLIYRFYFFLSRNYDFLIS